LLAISVFLISADHIDAPAVTGGGSGTTSDITDVYAFRAENPNNLVLVANVQGLLAPGTTDVSQFDENVLVEFNIDNAGDNNNDLVEDLVIQVIKRGDSMYFFGPTAPTQTGLSSTINVDAARSSVKISTRTDIQTSENNGMKFFAGPREDPFYFDFTQYNAILGGTEPGFRDPGVDTFAGTNVLSIVIEVPKAMLGDGVVGANPLLPTTPIYSVWVTSNRKQ